MSKAGQTWLLVVLTAALLASTGVNIYLWSWRVSTIEIANIMDTTNVDFRTRQYRKIRDHAAAGETREIGKLLDVLHKSDMFIMGIVKSRLANEGKDTTKIEEHIKEEEANWAEQSDENQHGET